MENPNKKNKMKTEAKSNPGVGLGGTRVGSVVSVLDGGVVASVGLVEVAVDVVGLYSRFSVNIL